MSVSCRLFWLFTKHLNASWFVCVFLAAGLYGPSGQISRRQRILSLLEVNPWFMFVSLQTANCSQSCSQPIMHSTAGYGSWISPKMQNSSWNWGSVYPDWDHLFKQFSFRLFWSEPEFHYCVHTHPNKPHRGGNDPEFDSTELKEAHVKTPLILSRRLEIMADAADGSFLLT